MRRLPTYPTYIQLAEAERFDVLWRTLDYQRSINSDETANFDAKLSRKYLVADGLVVTLPADEYCKVGDSVTLIGEQGIASYVIQANTDQTIVLAQSGGVDTRFGVFLFLNDTIPANDTLEISVTLAGVLRARGPRFALSITDDLPDGVVLKQPLRMDNSNNIYCTLENVTASPQNYTGNILFSATMPQALPLSSTTGGTATSYGANAIKLVYSEASTWVAEYYTGNFELA